MKTRCERALWYILPAVRRQVAIILKEKYGMSQKKIAKVLGLTEAAVSNYIRRKRGSKMRLEKNVIEKLDSLCEEIVSGARNFEDCVCEICRLVMK